MVSTGILAVYVLSLPTLRCNASSAVSLTTVAGAMVVVRVALLHYGRFRRDQLALLTFHHAFSRFALRLELVGGLVLRHCGRTWVHSLFFRQPSLFYVIRTLLLQLTDITVTSVVYGISVMLWSIEMIRLTKFWSLVKHCRFTSFSHISLTTFRSPFKTRCEKHLNCGVVSRHFGRVLIRGMDSYSTFWFYNMLVSIWAV